MPLELGGPWRKLAGRRCGPQPRSNGGIVAGGFPACEAESDSRQYEGVSVLVR